MWTSPGPDPGWAEHRTAQNSLQIKTEKSFTSGIFHFMFSVPETSGSGVGAEGRVTSVAGFPLQALLKVFGCVTASHGAGGQPSSGSLFPRDVPGCRQRAGSRTDSPAPPTQVGSGAERRELTIGDHEGRPTTYSAKHFIASSAPLCPVLTTDLS